MKGGEWGVWLDMESNHISKIRGFLLKLGSSKTDVKAPKWGLVEKSGQRSMAKIWSRGQFLRVVFDQKDEYFWKQNLNKTNTRFYQMWKFLKPINIMKT